MNKGQRYVRGKTEKTERCVETPAHVLAGVRVTVCPPGVARGAGDLRRWAKRRNVGESGVIDVRDEVQARKQLKQAKKDHAAPPWRKRIKKMDRAAARTWEADVRAAEQRMKREGK